MVKIYECLILIFILCLIFHTYTDCTEQLLYDITTVLLFISGILYGYIFGDLGQSLKGAAVSLLIMLIIYWASRGGMGLGDVKLACALGMWLGLEQSLLCLLVASISGGLIGVLLLATGIKSRKDAIPFGPFLCLGGWISLFYGNELLLWYWKLWL